jgi:peptidoglycan/xylan/chitin deacetylase (PgdA/CDA1 family)
MPEGVTASGGPRLLAILSYHKIGNAPRGAWEPWNYVPEAMLADQLQAVEECGWEVVDLRAVLNGLLAPDTLPERSALVTFDDGYRSLVDRALPVLTDRGYPGVVFVPAAYVGGVAEFDANRSEPLEGLCDWEQLRELEHAGISVQSHGFRHLAASEIDWPQLEDELKRSKAVLERGLAKQVEVHAFPYGDAGDDAARMARALERAGYRAACGYTGGPVALPADDPYRLSRLAIGFGTDVAAELARRPSALAG